MGVCGVWAVFLNEVVVQTGAGVWFEAVIGDVALAEIVTESEVWAGMLLGVVIEVGFGVWAEMLLGVVFDLGSGQWAGMSFGGWAQFGDGVWAGMLIEVVVELCNGVLAEVGVEDSSGALVEIVGVGALVVV